LTDDFLGPLNCSCRCRQTANSNVWG